MKPLTLIIMDGYGLNEATYGNAIKAARTPELDRLFAENPSSTLAASGMDVGLPRGQMGNSEVGHTNIGAGRVVYQELTRISKAIEDGDFFNNPVLLQATERCKNGAHALHIMGLVSDGGVHSHNSHIYAAVELAKRQGVTRVYIHCILDGRDVSPTSGAGYVKELEDKLSELGLGKVATVMGRYYAMDRDTRWERVELAYNAMALGEGKKNPDAVGCIKSSYDEGVTDEFVVPVVVDSEGTIKPDDTVWFVNFRPDRAREITRSLVDPEFTGFNRKTGLVPLYFVCMTQYDELMPGVKVAYTPQSLDMTFGEYISKAGLRQLRIAETTKYAHVTFFFNGGEEKVYPGEDRCLIETPKVATFDLKPDMSAFEVTEEVEKRIASGAYDVIILNFANCDMVGHTGVFDAAVQAVEAVDTCVGRVVGAVLKQGGAAIITADHGNADCMYEQNGSPFTAHTTNLVPFTVVGYPCKLKTGRLADIAPTMLHMLGLTKPAEMDGESLLI